ncbi:MAG: hypothetical protein ABFR53_05825 [Actinomycetota bacterium]
MTAAETIELAQGSVDQLQRGIVTVQEKLEQAESLAHAADRVVENVTMQARKMPRRMLICGAVAVCGIAAIVIIRKRKQARADEEPVEILT